jgi:hypothetical protein
VTGMDKAARAVICPEMCDDRIGELIDRLDTIAIGTLIR